MKKLILLFLLSITSLLYSENISIAVINDLKPLSFVENNIPQGFFIELFEYILYDYEIEYIIGNWFDSYSETLNGNIDIIPLIVKTPERELLFDFTSEYIVTTWTQILSLEQIESPLDLKDKIIGFMKNDQNAKNFINFLESFNIDFRYKEYSNYFDIELALLNNEIYAAPSIGYYLPKNNKVIQSNIVFSVNRLYYATKKGTNVELLEYISNRISELKNKNNSIYYLLLDKYIHNKKIVEEVPVMLWMIVFTLVATVIIVVFLLLIMNKIVALKTRELNSKINEINKITLYMPSGFAYHEFIFENEKPIDYIFIDVNQKFYDITKYKNICGNKLSDLLGKDVAKKWAQHWYDNLSNGILVEETYDDLTNKWYETYSYYTEKNKFVVILNDITENKLFNIKLEEMVEERSARLLENEKMASLGRTVAGFAHEINTPIGVALTASSFLLNNSAEILRFYIDGELTEEQFKEHLNNNVATSNIINLNLNRAAELIGSLKNMSTNQDADNEKFINLKDYFDMILLSLKPKFKNSNFTCKYDIENVIVNINPNYIFQIFTNLITNSIDHGFENRDYGNIYVKMFVSGDYIYITYIDDGCGISKEDAAKVFEPFFTTKRGNGKFTGLGLSIIYNMVEKLNGKIELENTQSGVKFNIMVKKK